MRLSWDEMFIKAKEYYIEHGNLIPPQTYICKDGTKLGAWISTQRAVRNGIRPGIMDDERIHKLDSIGMDWNPNLTAWNKGFCELELYYSENGDVDVPLRYVSKSGYKLGLWLQNQRRSYLKKGRGALNSEQISRLESLDISWDPYYDQWLRNYNRIKKYYEKYNNISLPKDYTVNGVNLFRWIDTQRQIINGNGKGRLSKKQKRLLIEIGVNPRNKLELRWEEMYELAKEYFEKYGHLSMIQSYSTDAGINLGNWIFAQRLNWRKGVLDPNRELLLNQIGMVWDYTSKKQTSFFEQAIFYYVSQVYKDAVSREKRFGMELDIYIPSIRTAIEYDGQVFHSSNKVASDERKNIFCKNSGITLYRIREQNCAAMQDEENNIYLKENTIDSFEEALILLFERLHVANVPDIKVNNDCGLIFGQFLMVGPPIVGDDTGNYILTTEWMNYYQLAKEYYEEFENLLIIRAASYKGKELGLWVSNQRHYYNSKSVPYPIQKITLLESIGMIWNVNDYRWELGFYYAKKYFLENGNLDVSANFTVDGYELGHWILNQRSKYCEKYATSGKLTKEQIQKLEMIGMCWNSLDYRWEEMFCLAEQYFNEHGDLRVPFDYVKSEKKLGRWISQQRKSYRSGNNSYFSENRVKRLEKIGMEWEIGKGNVRPRNSNENWENMFNIVKDYILSHPDVRITKRLRNEDNIQIGSWIYRQKRIYEGKENGVQEDWMLEKLKSVGLI